MFSFIIQLFNYNVHFAFQRFHLVLHLFHLAEGFVFANGNGFLKDVDDSHALLFAVQLSLEISSDEKASDFFIHTPELKVL